MSRPSAEKLTELLRQRALELGFDLVGATAAVELSDDHHAYCRWIEEGCAAGMEYLPRAADARLHPRSVLPEVRSLLVLALNYRTVEPADPQPGEGRISRYGWGIDYHQVVRRMLHKLADYHRTLTPDARVRGTVDTAPIFERAYAVRAGLGRIGKNTTLITERFGSWVVLGTLLTSESLVEDRPLEGDPCGECRECIDACPTCALDRPRHLDSRCCLSYLTIEPSAATGARPPLPRRGDRLFGCDACQEACPHNRRTVATGLAAFQPSAGNNPVRLADLLTEDSAAFAARFHDSPLQRPGRTALLLGAIDVLYEQTDAETVTCEARRILDLAARVEDPEIHAAAQAAVDRLKSNKSSE